MKMNWFTVQDKNLVWAPIGTYTNKNGEVKTRFIRIGVKVKMADGSWWFFSFKHSTWTKHNTRVQKMDRLGRPEFDPQGNPVLLPERKENYTVNTLHREWGKRKPELVSALESAVIEADSKEE
jgi:hypothetical protein